MIKLAIVDDHHLFREGIKSFFEGDETIELVGEASTGKEVLQLLSTTEINVLLLDINMPEMDGVQTTELLKKSRPEIKIIMLTMHETQNYIRKLLDIGVDGYLLKTTTKDEVLKAIHTVMNGEKFYGAEVQRLFINSFNSDAVAATIALTKREKEILLLICEEYNTNEIAEKLFISNYTVESHRKNLFSKTGAKNVVGLVKFAMENKFI